jgi:hypothetical protein
VNRGRDFFFARTKLATRPRPRRRHPKNFSSNSIRTEPKTRGGHTHTHTLSVTEYFRSGSLDRSVRFGEKLRKAMMEWRRRRRRRKWRRRR